MEKKIYFVGVHFKKSMKALDSRTISGKIIDRIIEWVKYPCEKINLFPTTYEPKGEEISPYVVDFVKKSDENGIYVLLGKKVQEYLYDEMPNSISVNHPSFANRNGRLAVDRYVKEIIARVNKN